MGVNQAYKIFEIGLLEIRRINRGGRGSLTLNLPIPTLVEMPRSLS